MTSTSTRRYANQRLKRVIDVSGSVLRHREGFQLLGMVGLKVRRVVVFSLSFRAVNPQIRVRSHTER